MQKTSDIIWQDAQHQVLFETLDLLRESVTFTGVLFKLMDYAEHHFSLEERYRVVFDYRGHIAHCGTRLFSIGGWETTRAGNEPDDVLREVIATFLTESLTRHVFVVDKKLEVFILQSYAK